MNFTDVDHEVWVTTHALDRLECHYPGITSRAARGILNRAIELDAGTVQPILGRPIMKHHRPSRYFLPEQREGLLVLEPERGSKPGLMPWCMVTYLRLEQSQQDLVDRLWPIGGGEPHPPVAPPASEVVRTTKDDLKDLVLAQLDAAGGWCGLDQFNDVAGKKKLKTALGELVGAGVLESSGNSVTMWRRKKAAA